MSTPIPQNCTWVDGMSPDDWTAATDPVPARRELTESLVLRMRAERQLRRLRKKRFKPTTIGTAWVDEGFEEMGA